MWEKGVWSVFEILTLIFKEDIAVFYMESTTAALLAYIYLENRLDIN